MVCALVEELGKLAAEAIDKRDQKKEEEKVRLGPHLEEQWKKLRLHALNVAKDGNTIYQGIMYTSGCKFTVFKPDKWDVMWALPEELKAVKEGQGPDLNVIHGSTELAPSFEFSISFVAATGRNLAKLKRDRKGDKDKDKEEDATEKRVKVSPF